MRGYDNNDTKTKLSCVLMFLLLQGRIWEKYFYRQKTLEIRYSLIESEKFQPNSFVGGIFEILSLILLPRT